MKRLDNEALSIQYDYSEAMHESLQKFSELVRNNPVILEPVRSLNDDIKGIFSSEGFSLYPTVEKTTLFFDPSTDSFFKVIHPLNFKNRMIFLCSHRAATIYQRSEQLRSAGVLVQRVRAYGYLKDGKRPFFVIEKARGESIYDLIIRGGKTIPLEVYRNVLDEVSKLHLLGYWFGDAHLSHIFLYNEEVSGFIDLDGIRKNCPSLQKNFAKDIAGLNHPGLPLSKVEKNSLIHYYFDAMSINDRNRFLQLVNKYTERRWKE